MMKIALFILWMIAVGWVTKRAERWALYSQPRKRKVKREPRGFDVLPPSVR